MKSSYSGVGWHGYLQVLVEDWDHNYLQHGHEHQFTTCAICTKLVSLHHIFHPDSSPYTCQMLPSNMLRVKMLLQIRQKQEGSNNIVKTIE